MMIDGEFVGLVMDQMWDEGEGGGLLIEIENIGREVGWRQKEKIIFNLFYLGYLCRNKGLEEGFLSLVLLD